MLPEGTILNHHYCILRLLSNKGGMGVVYQAADRRFNDDPVIIKQSRFSMEFLRKEYPQCNEAQLLRLGEDLRRAFEREARLLRKLQSDHLPRVIDYFSNDKDEQFLVMDFVPGKDFGELLEERLDRNEGPFPVEQVLDWADQLLTALAYLHSQDEPIIHRDIKPDNLKLTPNGRVMLLDFGLAKGAVAGMSVVGTLLQGGTLLYAPLEQLNHKGTDVRSDLYSLAVTLYQLLTGVLPADAVARVSETINGDPDPLRLIHELNPQVPPAVSEVLHKAAAIQQKNRHNSAKELREALRLARQPVPTIIAPPPPAPTIIDPPVTPPPRIEIIEPETINRPKDQIIVPPPPPPPPVHRSFVVDLASDVSLEMIVLPGGTFLMGSKDYENEKPIHEVTLSPFFIGKFPVTQAQWRTVMGNNPSRFKGDTLPVECVSWDEATEFCQKLSQKFSKAYRLPTEAEWEYACRAGSTGNYCFGDDVNQLGEYAWYGKNSGEQTHPVGQKKPNAFGLYDLHGNVWEWCADWYDGNYYSQSPRDNPQGPSSGQFRVLRGGSWDDVGGNCRSADRSSSSPGDRNHDDGFRVVVSARTQ